ncbi:hypothetical protein CLF_112980 [Clonorchis sinensis]|uniref:Uncharacterized protein n=1 Tax=Clonorchis sinensis TaxID=79923 RepID=G7YXE2_CLOSI|nr:hypothetical protein CLF_112980 [Clonorchis sinensis]
MVAGHKSVGHETHLALLDPFPLEDRGLRGDLILTCFLFEQGLTNWFFVAHPAYTRRGHELPIFGSSCLLQRRNRITTEVLSESWEKVWKRFGAENDLHRRSPKSPYSPYPTKWIGGVNIIISYVRLTTGGRIFWQTF